MHILKAICALALASFATAFPCSSQQSVLVSVEIAVTDQTGAVVSGASVETDPVSSSIPRLTNDHGQITLLLNPGNYKLSIQEPGFNLWTKNVEVKAGSPLSVTAVLTVGQNSGPIVVTPFDGLILMNGKILTGNGLQEGRPEIVSAIAISRGFVIAAGSDEEIKQLVSENAHVVNLKGAFVIPGLNDAHVHLGGAGQTKLNVDLTGSKSLDEMLTRVRDKAQQSPPGHWLTGGGWDHTLWADKTLPSRQELDQITGDHPALFERIDGHIAVANTAALKAANITGTTKSPLGGAIDIDGNGEPTGILRDTEMEEVEKIIPPPTHDERRQGLELAIHDAISHGLTSVQDFSEWDDFLVFEELEKEGKLDVRISEWLPFADPLATLKEHRAHHDIHDPMLHTGMLKGFMDGSLGSHTAALKAPYADDPTNSGLPRYDQAKLNSMAVERAQASFQLGFHAIGDKATSMALDAFSQTYDACPDLSPQDKNPNKVPRCWPTVAHDARDRVEHAQVVDPADIQGFAKLGVIASMQPNHLLTDMNWAEDRLGPRRAADSYVWKAFLDAGVPLAFGTDYPVEPVTPFRGLYAAVTRANEAGTKTYYPENKLTRTQALYAYTQGSAYAQFDEKIKGKLIPGYLADYIILDRNLLTVPASEILKTKVLETVVGGKTVYKDTPSGDHQ